MTALVCVNDLTAFGAIDAIQTSGRRVPDDVSVLTCLNARFMRRVNPRMSVINVRQEEVAAEAGRKIADARLGPQSELFPRTQGCRRLEIYGRSADR